MPLQGSFRPLVASCRWENDQTLAMPRHGSSAWLLHPQTAAFSWTPLRLCLLSTSGSLGLPSPLSSLTFWGLRFCFHLTGISIIPQTLTLAQIQIPSLTTLPSSSAPVAAEVCRRACRSVSTLCCCVLHYGLSLPPAYEDKHFPRIIHHCSPHAHLIGFDIVGIKKWLTNNKNLKSVFAEGCYASCQGRGGLGRPTQVLKPTNHSDYCSKTSPYAIVTLSF